MVTGKYPSANFIKRGDDHHGAAKFSKTAQSKTYIYNLEDLEGILTIVVNHSFIQFGDRWFWQNIGIPMGIGLAPLFANLYLAKPE